MCRNADMLVLPRGRAVAPMCSVERAQVQPRLRSSRESVPGYMYKCDGVNVLQDYLGTHLLCLCSRDDLVIAHWPARILKVPQQDTSDVGLARFVMAERADVLTPRLLKRATHLTSHCLIIFVDD